MQRRSYNNGIIIPAISILLLSDFLFLFSGCRTGIAESEKNPSDKNLGKVTRAEVNPEYVKFRSYQKLDST